MMFHFLKYLQPTHYFQLYRKDGTSIFPLVSHLPERVLEQIPPDRDFINSSAAEYDRSWRALKFGYTGPAPTYSKFKEIPLEDEYRFLRKYFHPVWVMYVFLLRIISFNNVVREVIALRRSSSKKRITNFSILSNDLEWENYKSTLLKEEPLISVIIPTLNRYEYLGDVLSDFERQDYKNFEIIIIDQSQPFRQDFYSEFRLKIRVLKQKEKALWLARNRGVEEAKSNIVAFSEDDVRIPADWLSSHLACLDFFDADISAGVFFPEGAEIPQDRSFFAIASQFASGNAMLYKHIFKKTGLFDRQFEKQRMGDGEFGLRTFLLGFKSISNPYAFCIDLKAHSGGLREMGSWDSFRPKNLLSPRPVPSVLYFYRKYFGTKRSLLALLKSVPPSIIPYRYRNERKFVVFGAFISLLLFPLVLLQVLISWRLATKKIEQGARIHGFK
ncbi:glycosyltransferase family A protein [Salinimicrobium xinjiangense]|uniref:glycosyltransferase family A protein n=1 Tax=Salinimicrobium xinjiangense TaxID=438596 RepID=UPI000490A063|nr:glycosyltransferase family A protein [Salinimicrobium xinjiangense]